MKKIKRILSVLAHPDDESFGMGGTLALYSSQGVEVYLICATRGEVGEVEPEFLEGYSSKGELRESELRCAAEKLGIKEVMFLYYRDSGMQGSLENQHPEALAAQKIDEVAAKITTIIRRIKPQIVLTFDPVGGYHHPDHIATHDATILAFNAASSKDFSDGEEIFQPEKLYFHIFPKGFIRFMVNLLKLFRVDVNHFGRNKDIDLEMLAGDKDYPRHAIINYKNFAKIKDSASDCHASQLDFGTQSPNIITWFRKLTGGKDSFMQAFPEVTGSLKKKDLFL